MQKRLFGLLCIVNLTQSLVADEGMWPLNQLPLTQIYERYQVKLDPEWITHVQKSCVRISLGGSGSFVSSNGLIMTNHHVGSKAIYNLSTEDRNLMEEGFYASSPELELQCPNMYVDQLIEIRDVTDEINRFLTDGMSAAVKEKTRKQVIAKLKKKAQEKTGLQPEVVILYQGARYHLYLYKRYSDIRLVMAPEKSIAFFGGDIENFEYPRHDFDVCFFRVYENGKPLKTDNYFKWSKGGPELGKPLFVAGHPGRTERLFTSDHLSFLKNCDLRLYLQYMEERITCLDHFAKQSPENARIANQDLFSFRNRQKVFLSLEKGLSESSIIASKKVDETALYRSEESADYLPWLKLKIALEEAESYSPTFFVLEGPGSRYSRLTEWAKHLVRWKKERTKPNELRLKEYTDSELPALELDLFSDEPLYENFERVLLVDSFNRLISALGQNHPAVKAALNGQSVEVRVDYLLHNTKLTSLEYRKKLYTHPEEMDKSSDAFITLALALDPYSREIREKKETELESVQKESYAAISDIIFKRYGDSIYPDATFTLRLSVGSMKGYLESDCYISPVTTLGGAFSEASVHQFKNPYQLPKSWMNKQDALEKSVPFNFVSTNDIIGGNSGSPVFNQKGEIVGLIFDGNVHSLIWDIKFDETQGRAVSVHSEAIINVLEKVYDAHPLVSELTS